MSAKNLPHSVISEPFIMTRSIYVQRNRSRFGLLNLSVSSYNINILLVLGYAIRKCKWSIDYWIEFNSLVLLTHFLRTIDHKSVIDTKYQTRCRKWTSLSPFTTSNPLSLLSNALMNETVCRSFQSWNPASSRAQFLVIQTNDLPLTPNSYLPSNVPPVVSLFADDTNFIFHGSDY